MGPGGPSNAQILELFFGLDLGERLKDKLGSILISTTSDLDLFSMASAAVRLT